MPVDPKELARRLRSAREAGGFTQEEVASRLKVSRPTIVQIEQGNRAVTSLELDRLAYLYGRDIRELLAEKFSAEDALVALFRRSAPPAGEVAEPTQPYENDETIEALRSCLALGREITNLEQHLEIDRDLSALPAYPLRTPAARWDAVQQGERAAAEERRRLGLGSSPLPNIAELLEAQGVRTAQVSLPADVSGLMLTDPGVGVFVVVNREHVFVRRRFSFAHEYCHVLLDRAQRGTISRSSERDSLMEVRANAFAASLLMPKEGVEEFLSGLAKGMPSRARSEVFDDAEAVSAQARPEPGSQRIQLHDVVLLAHQFGVSRMSALYRLKNLKQIADPEFQELSSLDTAGVGRDLAKFLALEDPDENGARDEFHRRFLALAFEALRRGKISRGKLHELGEMVEVEPDRIDALLAAVGIEEPDGEPPVLLGPD
jgi:Zn-dependent peptidase ImmA (M78 family)/DNA-binding XRE family transcriptional regulator